MYPDFTSASSSCASCACASLSCASLFCAFKTQTRRLATALGRRNHHRRQICYSLRTLFLRLLLPWWRPAPRIRTMVPVAKSCISNIVQRRRTKVARVDRLRGGGEADLDLERELVESSSLSLDVLSTSSAKLAADMKLRHWWVKCPTPPHFRQEPRSLAVLLCA